VFARVSFTWPDLAVKKQQNSMAAKVGMQIFPE
jgi:hypothetical protein